MYFCTSVSNNEFSIVDTTDNVTEVVTLGELKNYLNQGIEILGVTLESLSLGDKTTILVDIKGVGALNGRLFNGYYFEDYSEDNYSEYKNKYLYSVISNQDINIRDLLSYIQISNKHLLDKAISYIPDSECGYTLEDVFDNGMFNVKELSTMKEYGFNYCYAFKVLIENKLRIQGLSNLTSSEITINDNVFSLKDALNEELSETETNASCFLKFDTLRNGKEYVSDATFTSNGLSSFLQQAEGKYLTSTMFPIVSLFDYISSIPESDDLIEVLDNLMILKGDDYLGHTGSIFNFESGFVDISKLSDYVDLIDDTCIAGKDILSYKEVLKAKRKLIYGTTEDSVSAFRRNNDYYNGNNKPFDSVLDIITKDKYHSSMITKYGTIHTSTYIRDTDGECRISKIDGFDMWSITHTGSFYYRVGRSGITIYLSSSNKQSQAHYIGRGSFIKYLDYFRNYLGYYYNRPCIMPICLHSVVEHDFGVEINILVALNTNNFRSFLPYDETAKDNKERGWGTSYLVVPLLLTGTKHYIYKDFVIFKMLLQDVIIPKSLYNNLAVNVDSSNDLICIDKCAEVSSTKLCNCMIGNVSTSKSDAVRKSIKRFILTFNRKIDSLDYIE